MRELLRQRAIAVGILLPDSDDDEAIAAAIERLLADEVSVPSPTEAETRRYYENHLREFQSEDLVYARHILFQVTPSVSVPEIRARAERALSELLAEPDRFAAMARELSNCPSGQQGGNLGQIGRGDVVPEFERRDLFLAVRTASAGFRDAADDIENRVSAMALAVYFGALPKSHNRRNDGRRARSSSLSNWCILSREGLRSPTDQERGWLGLGDRSEA